MILFADGPAVVTGRERGLLLVMRTRQRRTMLKRCSAAGLAGRTRCLQTKDGRPRPAAAPAPQPCLGCCHGTFSLPNSLACPRRQFHRPDQSPQPHSVAASAHLQAPLVPVDSAIAGALPLPMGPRWPPWPRPTLTSPTTRHMRNGTRLILAPGHSLRTENYPDHMKAWLHL